MADLKIATQIDDENPVAGDLYLGNGTVRLTADIAEEFVQNLYIGLKNFRGEWFLNRAAGIPYWQSILGVKQPVAIVAQIFRRYLLSRPGLKTLDEFNLERLPNRKLQLNFVATLQNGVVIRSSDYAPFLGGA